MIKKNDFILVGAVIIICLGVLIFINATKKEGSKVIITIDGEVYDTLYLNEDTSYTIKGEKGAYNTFEIKDGYVNMLDASCPDKLCVKQKDIHYNHETIVCLPNKVVIEVVGGEDDDIDMIAN
ncbi:MAG: NusG domain II-containing protein [Herbinix sp.]|nr:NusG domain II-containing protein [Herbinix sp.]